MSGSKEIDAGQALDRFFAIVREEASNNPRLAARLAEAVGYQVVFRGAETLPAVDPVQIALKGQVEFRNTFLTFKAADLKKLVTEFNLGTKDDLKTHKTVVQLTDLMWAGATAKIRDRGLKS
ncbi:MAG: hypothetical protein ABL893_14665 [Hyphomicrobium sp.]